MEWKTVKLGDVCINGKGNYGIGASAIDYDPNKYTYLRITDINDDGTLNYSGLKSVDDDDAAKYILQENDIVFARTGASTGRTYFYNPNDGQLVYAGFLIKFSIDPKKVNPRLLKYITHSQEYYDWVHSFDTGGTRGNINAVTFANMPIILPDRKTQDKIVAILSSLDAKIENNNRINANLEAQAQALYKSWFVDFEPWGGEMPKDWEIAPLSSLFKYQEGPGIRNWQYVSDNGTKFINIRCIKDGDIFTDTANMISNDEANGKYAHFMLREGDVVMSCSGTLGRYAIVRKDHLPLCLNTSVIRFYPINPFDYAFMLGTLTSAYFLNKQVEMACGSVQANFGPTHLKQINILVPSEDIRKRYNDKCNGIISLVQKLKAESQRLAALRDTLLPKLMKGEIEL